MHETMFPGDEHDILEGTKLNIAKLAHHGAVTTDTCNAARKLNQLLLDSIRKKARNEGISENEINTHQIDCWHHLRNV